MLTHPYDYDEHYFDDFAPYKNKFRWASSATIGVSKEVPADSTSRDGADQRWSACEKRMNRATLESIG